MQTRDARLQNSTVVQQVLLRLNISQDNFRNLSPVVVDRAAPLLSSLPPSFDPSSTSFSNGLLVIEISQDESLTRSSSSEPLISSSSSDSSSSSESSGPSPRIMRLSAATSCRTGV